MWLDVYVGFLDDPDFMWGTTSFNGSVPHRKSPMFPEGHTHFWRVVKKIETGALRGKQVDNYGGYVAQVTKKELLEFLDEYYNVEWYSKIESFDYERYHDEVEKVRKYLWSLDSSKEYLIVAVEA